MFRLPPPKSEIDDKAKMQPSSLTSLPRMGFETVQQMAKAKATTNVKSWVYNTDLKYAIGDLRNQLMNEAKNTNAAMKEKIHEWVTRDYEEAADNITSKDTPVAKENEAMRQLISDLLNGPIASLLNKDGRNKLCKLSIPALPTHSIYMYDDTIYDDVDSAVLSAAASYGSFGGSSGSYSESTNY